MVSSSINIYRDKKGRFIKGAKFPPYIINKMSERFKGEKNPFYGKVPKSAFKKGHKVSLETRKKLSESMKGKFSGDKNIFHKIKFCNENHWNWQGGITKSKYYKRFQHFKRRVLRDGKPLSIKIVQRVYESNIKKYKTLTCVYCLKKIEFGKDCIDHKIPVSKGGTNEYNNLTISCRHCNAIKYTKTDKEFLNVSRTSRMGKG